MFFNSLSYIIFLILAVAVYWLIPRAGWRWLLVVSIVFYGFWKIEFLTLIIFSAFVDYYVSLRIYDAGTRKTKKIWFLTSIVINLGLLVYFKYAYFLTNNVTMLGDLFGLNWSLPLWKITLPLGISFYTFVSLSYTFDIYRGLIDPIRSFSLYLTYVMFWPHMIAGPILRGHELIGQLKRYHRFSIGNAVEGTKLIITGLFLKVVLADQLAPLVDNAFNNKSQLLGGLDVWTMAFGFGFQIYFDFAGYSLVAIGSARILGIRFPNNFSWPYLAVSPRDFWKRWHITLSSWVRDYLYLPLSGSRYRDQSDGGIDVEIYAQHTSTHRFTLALFLSWFLMGLWHGASWNFALWGVWHAALIYMYRKMKNWFRERQGWIVSIMGWCLTLPAVMLAWIPFRATSLRQTMDLLGKVISPLSYSHLSFRESFYLSIFLVLTGMLICAFVARLRFFFLQHAITRHTAETVVMSVMIYCVFVYLKPANQFIYFQF
jgi:alginate O-acetyltransferase complex protein AlgI